MFRNLGFSPPKLTAPFPPWDVERIKIVEEAISAAWQMLLADDVVAVELASASEPVITLRMQDALEVILNSGAVNGFSPAVFCPPIRGQELEDVSQKKLEKRPDLTFQQHVAVPATRHHALFFECKVLGRGRTVGDYVKDGVGRFCDGRYAWAMPHAGMIAYSFSTRFDSAWSVLTAYWNSGGVVALTIPEVDPVEEASTAPVCVTRHKRSFTLPNNKPPGAITLRHLWLRARDSDCLD